MNLDVFDLTDGSSIDVTRLPAPDSGLGTFRSCDVIFYDEASAFGWSNSAGRRERKP